MERVVVEMIDGCDKNRWWRFMFDFRVSFQLWETFMGLYPYEQIQTVYYEERRNGMEGLRVDGMN